MLGKRVEYPMRLLNILDKVHIAEMIQRSTYPQDDTGFEGLNWGEIKIAPQIGLHD